jgi:ferrous iron transport protein A
MFLIDIKPGEKAKILGTENMTENVRRRLLDLGIMEGTVICLKRMMPFGGPLTLEADGQWIGIRRREAGTIQVEAV